MIYLLFYWIVAGLAMYSIPTARNYPGGEFPVFLGCMIVGGVGIPAAIMLRLISKI